MLNAKEGRRTKCDLRVALAILLLTTSFFARGQTSLASHSANLAVDRQFANIGESLTSAADAAIIAGAETVIANTQPRPIEAANAILPLNSGQHPASWNKGGLVTAMARLDLLRPAVEPVLRDEGVPVELAAVILIESGGRTMALSPKGARGLWQMMPDTARRYGLRVDAVEDQRLDTLKSTRAAAQYLRGLHVQFGDWKLALAAYNAGEASVSSAIERARTQDFERLSKLRMLPLETRNYVPIVLTAMKLVMADTIPANPRSNYSGVADQMMFATAERASPSN